MPTTLLPPSVEAALCARPVPPRLLTWYEWPVRVAGLALPVVVFGTFVAGWLAQGSVAGIVLLVFHALLLAVIMHAVPFAKPAAVLHKLIAKHGKWQRFAEWLVNDWKRLPALGLAAGVLVMAYCEFVALGVGPLMAALHQRPLSYPMAGGGLAYGGAVALAAGWGLLRAPTYNRDFRDRFQAFKRAAMDLDSFRRHCVWQAVGGLPRLDFDGRRARHGKPTPTAIELMEALQRRGIRMAEAPGSEVEGPRLILEYELVGLGRGLFNYRADLALVIPGKNVKLDIELDGGYHQTLIQRGKDAIRNARFLDRGWAVVRFDNEDVRRDVWACVSEIERVLEIMQRTPRLDFEGTTVA